MRVRKASRPSARKLAANTALPFGRCRVEIDVITFQSVAQAFRAEKILQGHNIAVRLIPIPRSLSGCCEGLAARVVETDIAVAVEVLSRNGVEMIQRGVRVRAD